jgi:predicted Zn-dependent protease
VQLASLLSEDLYREELARLARYHKDDPTAAFTLIDYYFFENNSAAAMEAIVGMERAFGADGVMAMMKANLAAQSGDLPKARGFAERSVELEPENETSRWTLLTILLNSKEYADSIDVLEGLESDFDYEFDDTSFVGNETFAGFIESPEYEDWIATR